MSILYPKPGSIIMAEKHGIYRIGDVSRCQANLWWRHIADQPMNDDHHSLWVFAWKWRDVVGTLFGGWFHRNYGDLWVICIYIYTCHMSFCCKHHFGMIRKSSERLISEYDLGKMLPQFKFMVLATQGSAVLAHPQVYTYTYYAYVII